MKPKVNIKWKKLVFYWIVFIPNNSQTGIKIIFVRNIKVYFNWFDFSVVFHYFRLNCHESTHYRHSIATIPVLRVGSDCRPSLQLLRTWSLIQFSISGDSVNICQYLWENGFRYMTPRESLTRDELKTANHRIVWLKFPFCSSVQMLCKVSSIV